MGDCLLGKIDFNDPCLGVKGLPPAGTYPPPDGRGNGRGLVAPVRTEGRVAPQDKPVFRPQTIGRCMAEVEPSEIHWLMPNKIPQARLTVLVGDGGVGKSFLSLAIAATLSRGADWPGQPGSGGEPGTTVLMSAEDDASDTIRVRLDAAGADCSRIHIIEGVQRSERGEPAYFSILDDLAALEAKIEEVGARLCIVDPVGAYLLGVDSHRDSSVRTALGPLAGLASRTRCAILSILHINKDRTAPKASDRVCGSVAFSNAARMGWFVGIDPEDESRRVFVPFKHNIIERPEGLAFQLIDGAVHWLPGTVALDAEAMLASGNENRTERSEAAEWLTETLARGPLPVAEIRRAAEADCHSWRTIERVKKSLNVRSRREGYGSTGRFVWELSEVAVNEPIDRQPDSGGQCDNSPETAVFPIDRQVRELAVNERDDRRDTPF